MNAWANELEMLTNIISKTELVATIKWGGPVFTYNGKNVMGISGFKNYFAIWFYKGVLLKDESVVLMNAQEGITKSLRQWRFTSKEQIDETLLLSYISEAIAIEKSKI